MDNRVTPASRIKAGSALWADVVARTGMKGGVVEARGLD